MTAIETEIDPPITNPDEEDVPTTMVYVSINTADGHSYSANASIPNGQGTDAIAEHAVRVLKAAARLHSRALIDSVNHTMTTYGKGK